MVTLVLALLGSAAQVVGFIIAAVAVRKAWKTAQVDERFWFPEKNRNVYATDVAVAIDFAVTAEVEVVLPAGATADQKIAWLIGRVRDLERNTQAQTKNFAAELREQRGASEQRMNAIGAEIAGEAARYLRGAVAELRVTAWGLVLAIVGLALQVPILFQ